MAAEGLVRQSNIRKRGETVFSVNIEDQLSQNHLNHDKKWTKSSKFEQRCTDGFPEPLFFLAVHEWIDSISER